MTKSKKVNEEELAVISAVIESIERSNGKKFVLKSFKRLQSSRKAWSSIGRIERMRSSSYAGGVFI